VSSSWRLPAAVRRAIVRHAIAARPQECCGFLIGRRRETLAALPMPNVAETPATRFRIDDAAHVEARRLLRRFDPPIEIVGVYHSHPGGAAIPSPVDVAEAYYPDWLYVIVGLGGPRPSLRAFRISHGKARPQRLAP
jgi:proteasome lid subunit RPN8/RPN11